MARGQDTSKHPGRQVGRTTFYDLDPQGHVGVTWGDSKEDVPLSELRHADEDSPLYGRKVSKTHLKNVAKKNNPANYYSSSAEVSVYRDI